MSGRVSTAALLAAVASVGGGISVALALTGDGHSASVTLRGVVGESAYRAAFRTDDKRACMHLRVSEGQGETSSEGCSGIRTRPVGMQHALCDRRQVFVYGVAPSEGHLSVQHRGAGLALRGRSLGSMQAFVVALSAWQLPASVEYQGASGEAVDIAVPSLATACRAQSGIAHPTDVVGYLR
jgi:hypothetical protein